MIFSTTSAMTVIQERSPVWARAGLWRVRLLSLVCAVKTVLGGSLLTHSHGADSDCSLALPGFGHLGGTRHVPARRDSPLSMKPSCTHPWHCPICRCWETDEGDNCLNCGWPFPFENGHQFCPELKCPQ